MAGMIVNGMVPGRRIARANGFSQAAGIQLTGGLRLTISGITLVRRDILLVQSG